MIDIRQRIEELSREKGLSLTYIAERIGMPQPTLISALKTGDPKISVMMKIADVFGMTISEIMQDGNQNREATFSITCPNCGKKIGLFPMVIR